MRIFHPGDVVAYGAATVHCAWSNVSKFNVRVALDVRYEPMRTPDSILRPDIGNAEARSEDRPKLQSRIHVAATDSRKRDANAASMHYGANK